MSARSVELARPASLHPTRGYSHFTKIQAGALVYFAGQVAMDGAGNLVGPGALETQLEQVFANLDTAVREAGGSFRDVVKLNYFCVDRVDPSAMPAVGRIRDRFIDIDAPPVSTFVFVSRLARPDWLIEVEAVAVLAPSQP